VAKTKEQMNANNTIKTFLNVMSWIIAIALGIFAGMGLIVIFNHFIK
jgi:hypothetical protein